MKPDTALIDTERRVLASGKRRIRPRARLLRTLGAELISSEIVAVLELVRNSYDADARRVEIRFIDPHRPDQAEIELRDDGHGMPQEILLGPWLEPATAHKSAGSSQLLGGERSPAGRRRLGSKGVGRFAAQRLGHHLLVRTRAKRARSELEAAFDWDRLDRADQYLDQLRIPWQEITARRASWSGTSLVITRLRDSWTEERFNRLRLALSRLVGPGLGDEEFEIRVVVNGAEEQIRPTIETMEAMYAIEGAVAEGGRCTLTYRDIGGTEEQWERSVGWRSSPGGACGPFRFLIKAWDLDREALTYFFERTAIRSGIREFRGLIRDHSGVSLYRDGFRILPYGEPDNDWLRLDRRRVNNPTLRLSNNQILGWLLLGADGNPQLQDQTNREGLVTTEAYSHLQEVALELLSYLETRRFGSRRTLKLAPRGNSATLPVVALAPEGEVENILESLESEDGRTSSEHLLRLREHLKSQRQAASEAIRQYSGLAVTGQLSGLVFSQLKHPIGQLQTEVLCLRDEIADIDLGTGTRSDIESVALRMERLLKEMAHRMEKIDPLAVSRKTRRTRRIDLVECVDEIAAIFIDLFVAAEIDYETIFEATTPIESDPYVLQNVIAILFDNSTYWLRQLKGMRRLRVIVEKSGFVLRNNGPKIAQEHRRLIFDPHFTTREDATGMGLTLARDLLMTIGARIDLVEDRKETVFRVGFSNS